MELISLEFSRFAVYLFLILAIGIFFLFRGFRKLVPVIFTGKRYRENVFRFLPLTELFVWLVYIVWAIQFFWHNNQLYAVELSLILTVLAIWVCWYALRDHIAGAILKAGRSFTINESVIIGDAAGKVRQMKSRCLVIETDTGESIFIPYSQITGKQIVKIHPAETILAHTFRISNFGTGHPAKLISGMSEFIMNLPWSSVKKEPKVQHVESRSGSGPFLEITVYAIEKDFFYDIERHVRKRFDKDYK